MSTKQPLVSVIIPFYSKEAYLAECLDSILGQSLQDIEVVCVNNNAAQNCVSTVKEYMRRDERVKLCAEKKQGAGAARNKGLQKAAGEFLAFMDSDDLYYDNQVLEKLYRTAKKERVQVVGGNIYMFNPDGSKVENEFMHIKKYGLLDYKKDFQCNYGFTRFIYSSSLIKSNGITFPELQVHEDPVFMTKALLAAKKLFVIKDFVYKYRMGVTDYSAYSEKQLNDMKQGIFEEVVIAEDHHLYSLHDTLLRQIDDYAYIYSERKSKELRAENARLKDELAEHLSIKRSARLLVGNIKRRIRHGKGR